ncbi:hypothetical protein V7127_11180, partial [Bacillus sp. JJ1773]|uniref:hypothetical protein n=1 Tax=Bacillus sp. JJ1773 TaxID=3122965 RepID=UPI002FFF4955
PSSTEIAFLGHQLVYVVPASADFCNLRASVDYSDARHLPKMLFSGTSQCMWFPLLRIFAIYGHLLT